LATILFDSLDYSPAGIFVTSLKFFMLGFMHLNEFELCALKEASDLHTECAKENYDVVKLGFIGEK
jgi:hypothetical protein